MLNGVMALKVKNEAPEQLELSSGTGDAAVKLDARPGAPVASCKFLPIEYHGGTRCVGAQPLPKDSRF